MALIQCLTVNATGHYPMWCGVLIILLIPPQVYHHLSSCYPNSVPDNHDAQQTELQIRRATAKANIDRNMSIMKKRFDSKHKKCKIYVIGQLVLWKGGITRDPTAKVGRKLGGVGCSTDH